MQLDEGMRLHRARLRRSEIADAPQFIADRGSVLVGRGIGLVEAEAADIDQAAHHVGLEARALLVGEEGHRDRPARRHAGLVQCLHDLEPRQHAVIAVVAAAGADGVDMAAGHDRREVLGAGAHADHVADRIDRHGESQRLHPAHDPVATSPVLVGQRQPRAAAAVDGADGSQLVEGAQQAPFIQSQHEFPCGTKTLAVHVPSGKISRRLDPDCLASATGEGHLGRR